MIRQTLPPEIAAPDAPSGLPRQAAFWLLLIPLVHGIGQSLLFAILPAVARDLGISETGVSLIYMLPAIAWSLITAWWGRRCDVWGRRPVMLLGLIGFAASMLAFALATAAGYAGWTGAGATWALILLSRLLYSALSSGTLPAAQAYVVDRSTPQTRTTAIGRLTAAWNLGNMLGPGVIGVLTLFGMLTPMFAAAAFAIVIWFVMRGRLEADAATGAHSGSPRLRFSDRRLRSALVVGICGSMAQATLLQTLGYFFMDHLGTATADVPRVVGVALMAGAFATLFSQAVLAPRLRLSPEGQEVAGLATNTLAFTLLVLTPSIHLAWAATLLCGLGYGLLRPGNVSRASLAVGSHEQGAVAGMLSALWSGGFIISPLFAMPLHHLDPRLPFVAAALVLASALTVSLLERAQTQEAVSV